MKLFSDHILFAVLTSSLLLTACSQDDLQGLGEEKDKAKVIFINAAPNAATMPTVAQREIAIWPFYNGVQFNNFPIKFPWSNGYKAFIPGNLVMRFDTARSQANNPSDPAAKVAEVTIPTAADGYYSVYAVGTSQKVEIVALTDNLALPTVGKAKIRIMNYSPDAGPIDIAVIGVGGTVLANNLIFKGIRDFFEIDPGIYTLEIREVGTARVLRTKTSVIIDKASCYSIWTRGFKTLPSPGNTNAGYALDLSYHANRWTNPL